jgi:hypothetical protein
LTSGFVFVTPVLLGVAHAFDADHIVAVSALVSATASPWRGVRMALGWGLGHMVPILGVAAAGVLLGAALPPWTAVAAERAAGLMLVALGVATLAGMKRRGLHIHTHAHGGLRHTHFHAHGPQRRWHDHAHVAVVTGLVHGLAGSAAPMVLVSLSAVHRPAEALLFAGVFGLAVAATMAGYAFCLGHLTSVVGGRTANALLALRAAAAAACLAVGTAWIVGG